MKRRGSGILLHLSSLPSPFGIGDLGPWAYRFLDFLAEAKQSYWQILPLNPTDPIYYNSPYQSPSAFAFNPLFISPEILVRDGLVRKADGEPLPEFPAEKVDYAAVQSYKNKLLALAFSRFQKNKNVEAYENFCRDQSYWLDDFALFLSLKTKFSGKVWSAWPRDLRDRNPEALKAARNDLSAQMELVKFYQFIFFQQWLALKNFGQSKGVQIFGDLPIYVNYDSADLWVNPELFKLDPQKKPYVVAGVPPDYFSKTGQLWGNPIYRWDVMKEKGYAWWNRRIAHALNLFAFVRIDHFRGLVAHWEVPAGEKTAVNGRWVEAPAMDFLNQLQNKFSSLPLIAEDLGTITPDVLAVINHFQLPGMKVLLFAFDSDLPLNPYLPHNFPRNCVAYTGTHDNNTVRGWLEKEGKLEEKRRLFRYLGRELPPADLPWELIRLLMMSVADTTIFPMQEILGLGGECRMNHPSTLKGNWEWRLLPAQLTNSSAQKLRDLTEIYGRG